MLPSILRPVIPVPVKTVLEEFKDVVVGVMTGGKTYSWRSTVYWPSFALAISSCRGFNGSHADIPNNISTVATTLPGLEIQIKRNLDKN